MKKVSWKGKALLGTLGATTLIAPLIIVSAVACFSEKKPIDKSKIILNTKPVNGTLFLNQDENLPILSVEAKVDNQNTQLAYQWYESDSNSTTNGKIIPGATQSTYAIPKSYTQKTGTKYFYAVVNSLNNGNILNSVISEIYTININQIPTINIDKQPLSQKAIINQQQNLPTFSIAVNDIKNAKLTYEWYSNTTNSNTNGMIINGATNSSYTINSSSLSTEGQKYYYVKVSGSINGIELTPVISNTAVLDVTPLPKIMISNQPKNLESFMNQTNNLPTFSVDVSNIEGAQLKYQWYSNTTNSTTGGTIISGANDSSYTVPSSDLNTVGQKHYYVQVSGTINGLKLQSLNSNSVSLIVKALPKIIISSTLQNSEAVIGQKTNLPTFSVSATTNNSNQRLTYQWYENVSNSTTGGTIISGATSSSYIVPPSSLNAVHQKYYYVEISGTINELVLQTVKSNVATLKVNALPIINIQTQPVNQTVIEGTKNLPTFSVAVNNIEGVQFRYQWYWSTTNPNDPWYLIDGATSSSYKVQPSDVSVSGIIKHYYVRVYGSINGVPLARVNSSVATLMVNALPTINITNQPKNLERFIKQTNNLPVLSVGIKNIQGAHLNYQWYKSNTNSTTNGNPISGANSSSYTIPSSDLTNVGSKHYFVQISGTINGLNLQTVKSNVATLKVNALPKITINNQPKDQPYYYGKPDQTQPVFSISAKINSSNVKLKYQWYKNEDLTNSGWKIINGANSSSYTVPKSDIPYPENGEIRSVLYYVKIIGVINGEALQYIDSNIARLNIIQFGSKL